MPTSRASGTRLIIHKDSVAQTFSLCSHRKLKKTAKSAKSPIILDLESNTYILSLDKGIWGVELGPV